MTATLEERIRAEVDVYDNGGRTFDRYTAVFADDGDALAIGPTGNVPNGVCMHLGYSPTVSDDERVEFDALPEPVQRAIRGAFVDWYVAAPVAP